MRILPELTKRIQQPISEPPGTDRMRHCSTIAAHQPGSGQGYLLLGWMLIASPSLQSATEYQWCIAANPTCRVAGNILRSNRVPPVGTEARVLFLSGLELNLLNDECGRTSPLKHLPAGSDSLSCKRQQLVVLPAGRSGFGDGPVNFAVVAHDHQGRTSFGTGGGTFFTDRFLQVPGESACGVQDIALYRGRPGPVVRWHRSNNSQQCKQESCNIARIHLRHPQNFQNAN